MSTQTSMTHASVQEYKQHHLSGTKCSLYRRFEWGKCGTKYSSQSAFHIEEGRITTFPCCKSSFVESAPSDRLIFTGFRIGEMWHKVQFTKCISYRRRMHYNITLLQIKFRGICPFRPLNLYRMPNCSGSRSNISHPSTHPLNSVTETQICLLFHLEIDAVVRRVVFHDHAMNSNSLTYLKPLQNILQN